MSQASRSFPWVAFTLRPQSMHRLALAWVAAERETTRREGIAPEKILRKQGWGGGEIMIGCGQGGFVVALTSLPTVLQAPCQWRVVALEEVKAFRLSLVRVRALLVIDPLVMPTNSSMESVMRSFPEAAKLHPVGLYRELLLTKRYT